MPIFCYDEFSPEDTAMMQALYSRSAQSVTEHVAKVQKTGSGKFMESFYVGYGHNSIADCGSTTIFIEDVSTFVTKAFQSHPLYSGQETSTRYIDMSKQKISDPVATKKSREILQNWMDFYLDSQDELREYIKQQFPRQQNEDEKVYDKAVKARSFDILRGFLPAGIHTQFSWHTNLRQAHDALDILIHHPLKEVRETAAQVLATLKEKYPHSFSHKIYKDSENYREFCAQNFTYYFDNSYLENNKNRENSNLAKTRNVRKSSAAAQENSSRDSDLRRANHVATSPVTTGARSVSREEFSEAATRQNFRETNLPTPTNDFRFFADIRETELAPYRELFATRPPKTNLPQFLAELGLLHFDFKLDFGSFRDLQRHRNGVCRMPLLTTDLGFNQWYLDQLPENLRETAENLISNQIKEIAKLACPKEEKQYYAAMGFDVSCSVSYGLPAAIYVIELRSGNLVHPTLRSIAHQMSRSLFAKFPEIKLHTDFSPGDWDVRRGAQDIVAK